MATLVGISIAAKRGILFKEATFLETMAKSDILALDKTGTITEGKPSVVKAEIFENFDSSLLHALVNTSNHPISKGLSKYLEETYEDLQPLTLEKIQSIEAKGISATYESQNLIGGNAELMKASHIAVDASSENALFFFAVDSKLVARFELTDTIREGAKEAIANIQNLGIKVVMLTGDTMNNLHKKLPVKLALMKSTQNYSHKTNLP